MQVYDKIKTWAVLAFSALTAWLGILALPMGLLVLCNVLDYITGLAAAPARGQKRNSKQGLDGIVKKVCSWLLIVVGMVVDTLLGYLTQTLGWQLPFGFLVAVLVCIWLLANELLSVIENISDLTGVVPPFLKPLVNWIKGRAEDSAQDNPGG